METNLQILFDCAESTKNHLTQSIRPADNMDVFRDSQKRAPRNVRGVEQIYPLSRATDVMLDIEWSDWGTDKSLPALERFVESGGDVNAIAPESGMNLLWLAAEQMDIPLIRRLGELGADPNRQLTDSGVTAVPNAVDIDIDSVMQCDCPANSSELIQLVTSRLLKQWLRSAVQFMLQMGAARLRIMVLTTMTRGWEPSCWQQSTDISEALALLTTDADAYLSSTKNRSYRK